jgi:hypothetical protein
MLSNDLLLTISNLSLDQKIELQHWVREQIQVERQQQKTQKQQKQRASRRDQQRIVVDVVQIEGKTYQRELVDCGNKRCLKCVSGPAHGPYWYAYAWSPKLKKVVSRYIGKQIPTEKGSDQAQEL